MNYHTLVTNLLALETLDVQAMNRLFILLSEISDPATKTLLGDIKFFEQAFNVVNVLNAVTITPPDTLTQRDRFLHRIQRLAGCEAEFISNKATYPAGAPLPYFQQFDIVYVNFGGVGWELDGPHFALVWEDNHLNTEITVIPTTSQYTKDFATEFSIGVISGLPATKTVLTIPKTMRISRKRVILHKGKYVQGTPPRGQLKFLKPRIQDAMAVWMYGYQTLEQFIKNETASSLPVDLLTHYTTIRFTPVVSISWDSKALKVHYRPWNEPESKELDMKNPNEYITRDHKIHKIYEKVFSQDSAIKLEGITEFKRLF